MRAATEWESSAFFRLLDLRVVEVTDGAARLQVRLEAVRIRGAREAINGGIVATLGEAAMHVCLDGMLVANERIGSTRELTVAYLSGARGDTTTIEARMLRKGRLAVGDVELRDAATGELNAKLRVTCDVVRERMA